MLGMGPSVLGREYQARDFRCDLVGAVYPLVECI